METQINEYLKDKIIPHYFDLFINYFITYIFFLQLSHHHYAAGPEPLS